MLLVRPHEDLRESRPRLFGIAEELKHLLQTLVATVALPSLVGILNWHAEGSGIAELNAVSPLADNNAHNMETGDYSGEIKEIRALIPEAMTQCFSIKDLAISGNDLIELGIEKGPKIGEILNSLLEEVMDETLPNEYEKLIERVKVLGTSKA